MAPTQLMLYFLYYYYDVNIYTYAKFWFEMVVPQNNIYDRILIVHCPGINAAIFYLQCW